MRLTKKYKHLFELDVLKAYYKLNHIEQIRLLWNMLSDENKVSFEKCFYCQMYVDKVHATIITPPIEETIDGWIGEYYDSDETENISLFEFMYSKIKQVVLIDG